VNGMNRFKTIYHLFFMFAPHITKNIIEKGAFETFLKHKLKSKLSTKDRWVISTSWIHKIAISISRIYDFNFNVNSWSWNCEFTKMKSWIFEVEIVNSWIWNHEFVTLKSWIREAEIVNSRSWICDIEIVNFWRWNLAVIKLKSWSCNRKFVKLKLWTLECVYIVLVLNM
jgi:hypothetical protein